MRKYLYSVSVLVGLLASSVVFAGEYPSDGPQRFSNTVRGFMWVYTHTDNNGCDSCSRYSSSSVCDQQTVGQSMSSREPGTKDNDYVYTCVEADRSINANLPPNGPQYFRNTAIIFKWVFSHIDNHKCDDCYKYRPNTNCNSSNVGMMMSSRQPGTKDNEYVYVCDQVSGW